MSESCYYTLIDANTNDVIQRHVPAVERDKAVDLITRIHRDIARFTGMPAPVLLYSWRAETLEDAAAAGVTLDATETTALHAQREQDKQDRAAAARRESASCTFGYCKNKWLETCGDCGGHFCWRHIKFTISAPCKPVCPRCEGDYPRETLSLQRRAR